MNEDIKVNSFEDILKKDGMLIYKTKGISMLPMLHENRDLVNIVVPEEPIRKYDVVLYKRGESYVLHRVIAVTPDNYLIRGDNTYSIETIQKDAVIGVLTQFTRKGKDYSVDNMPYIVYSRIWCIIYPMRFLYLIIKRKIRRAAGRCGFKRRRQ